MKIVKIVLLMHILVESEAAKILAFFEAPAISHQVVFRPYTQELARRGHDVSIYTTFPAFPDGNPPGNLTETSIYELLLPILTSKYHLMKIAEDVTMSNHFDGVFNLVGHVSEAIFTSDLIEELKKKHFDLLIVEAYDKTTLFLSHILQIPVVQISSFGSMFNYEVVGSPFHPFLYPDLVTQRIHNLTLLERFHETYVNVMVKNSLRLSYKKFENFVVREFGPDAPSIDALCEKVTTLMLNVQPIWEENRPVPLGVSYISGVHRWPKTPIAMDVEEFINASTNGVVYMSLGTNVHPSTLPKEMVQMLLKGLERLPQNVLLKWDKDELPWKPKNVMIKKWFPQIAVLSHPNVKLFITQGGLQSTEEAIDAGIPMIGIPFLFDQWTNVERYVRHKIGLRLQIETLTEDQFVQAVNAVIGDNSYRENIIRFRTLLRDQPHNPLDLAVWWTEYAIRYSDAYHLRAPAANMPWTQYCELELLLIVLCTVAFGMTALCGLTVLIFKNLSNKFLRFIRHVCSRGWRFKEHARVD